MKNLFNYIRMFCLGACATLMAMVAIGSFNVVELISIALVFGLCFGFFLAGFFKR